MSDSGSIESSLLKIIHSSTCCDLSAVPIAKLPEKEGLFFRKFMPTARTAIALAHHITTIKEWVWY